MNNHGASYGHTLTADVSRSQSSLPSSFDEIPRRSGEPSLRTKIAKRLALIIAVFATVGLAAAPANASALGTSGWGWVSYNGVGGARGVYYAYLSGSGTYVSYVKGWPYMTTPVSGTICNWNITAEFFDGSGRWYKTYTGPTHWTCNSYFNQANADYVFVSSYMKPGRMCSTLKSNGARLTSVCHSIN